MAKEDSSKETHSTDILPKGFFLHGPLNAEV